MNEDKRLIATLKVQLMNAVGALREIERMATEEGKAAYYNLANSALDHIAAEAESREYLKRLDRKKQRDRIKAEVIEARKQAIKRRNDRLTGKWSVINK